MAGSVGADQEVVEATADRIFMEVWDQCLLPRGMRPHDLFASIDKDGSGEISVDELREGLATEFGVTMTDDEFDCVKQVADKDGSGNIEMSELVAILARGENAEAVADRVFHRLWTTLTKRGMRVIELYHAIDEDRSGEITLAELRAGLKQVINEEMTDYEFSCVSKIADKDGSGEVDMKELVRIVARGDKKRMDFRKDYEMRMRQRNTRDADVATPVTPVSSDGESSPHDTTAGGAKRTVMRTPSPMEGADMMDAPHYSPDHDVKRSNFWSHKQPGYMSAALRVDANGVKRTIGAPDTWWLKYRQANYAPEQILVAANRQTNKVQRSNHRTRAIEEAARAAAEYQAGPPPHGTHGARSRPTMSIVEQVARNQLFAPSAPDKASSVQRATRTRPRKGRSLRRQSAPSTQLQGDCTSGAPPTGLDSLSYVSGSSALPSGCHLATDSVHASRGSKWPRLSRALESLAEPLYWRQRVKHPSARHSIRRNPGNKINRMCYPLPASIPPRRPKQRKGLHSLEQKSSMLARRYRSAARKKMAEKRQLALFKSVYLQEPHAIRQVVKLQQDSQDEIAIIDPAQSESRLRKRSSSPRRPTKPLSPERRRILDEKARRAALHTELGNYREINADRPNEAGRVHNDIAAFEQHARYHKAEWQPTTGKDWHREQRFLRRVLDTVTDKEERLQYSDFERRFKGQAKMCLKRVAEKGYEYVKMMNTLKLKQEAGQEDDENEEELQQLARRRLNRAMVGAQAVAKDRRIRKDRLDRKEARLLTLRNFTGFQRRHLEFIAEQLYFAIIAQFRDQKIPVMQAIREAFDAMDEDKDATVSTEEFQRAVMRLDLGLSDMQIQEFLEVIDRDGDGELDKVEFLRAMAFVHKKQKQITESRKVQMSL